MKRITLTIDIRVDKSELSWTLEDWRGQVATGVSADSGRNLVAMWAGDIEHLLDDASYEGSGVLQV